MSDYEPRINPPKLNHADQYSKDVAKFISMGPIEDLIPQQMREALDKAAQVAGQSNPAPSAPTPMTLPTDSEARKGYPLYRGCLKYFPAALAGVSRISKAGNDKHNPGQEMHHARGKSSDHGDCILRHLIDVTDLLASYDRHQPVETEAILNEANQLAWRVLAFSQELHERFGAPLAPGARKS